LGKKLSQVPECPLIAPKISDMAPTDFGTIRYKIKYDNNLGKLHVTVVECHNLKKVDMIGSIDPYVKVFLMPGNHADLKTKSLKKDQNPSFNDEFSFVIDVENAQKKTIVFQVYDKDLIGKDDPVCEKQVPLWLVDMTREVDETEILEKAILENKKPVLKLKRPPTASHRSSVSSMASNSNFSTSGGHTSTYKESYQSSSATAGQGFHGGSSTVGGSGFHGSGSTTGGSGFHGSSSTTGGSGFHGGSSVSAGQGYHSGGNHFSSTSSQHTVVRNSGYSSDETRDVGRPLSQDHAFSLHLLNERLEKYISKIKLMPESNRASISIVEKQDAKGLDIESLSEYREWMEICRQYELEEEQLAKLRTENEALSFENASIQSGNDRLEYEIREFEAKIQKMREDIEMMKLKYSREKEVLERQRVEKEQSLEGAFNFVQELPSDWRESNVEILVNNARASIFDEKRRFIESVNARDWEEEKTSQSFDKNEIKRQIKEKYDIRLRQELEKISAEYADFFEFVNKSTKEIYKNKLEELRRKMNEMTPDERREVEEIMRKLKEAKDRIKDLELEKLKLSQKERGLTESLEEDEVGWKAELDEKKRELAWLQEQFHSLEFAYSEFSKTGGVSEAEVRKYSELIQSVDVNNIKKHAELFYEGGIIEQESSSSSSSSSSSEDEGDLHRPGSRASRGSVFT